MKTTFKIEGLSELDKALAELPKATGKNVLRRVARKALTPVAEQMRDRAPKFEGHLAESAGVGSKLTRRQASMHRKAFKDDRASIEMFAGVNDPAGVQQEFGNAHNPPQPFARPAWDATKDGVLATIRDDLGSEIAKAAKRLAKKRGK